MRWPVPDLFKLAALLRPVRAPRSPRTVRTVRPANIHYHGTAERERRASKQQVS
jgi:hypothetical protein